jgi:hypothetical protein
MKKIDRVNGLLAALVFLGSFVVYALTVQRSFSFWDCGEFIACAYTLGIPHPSGFPLFVLLGRIISLVPFVEDVSYRINYLSVISSAFTAMFSYLLVVKLVGYFFPAEERSELLPRLIAYFGGIAGGFFVAFSETNWANSVEAEVYGLSLALMVALMYLAIRYWELAGSARADRIKTLVFYLAMLGIGVHMTVFLVMPVCAIFFMLKKREATPVDFAIVCVFGIVELLLVMAFADGRGGIMAYYIVSALLALIVFILLFRKINWGIAIAIVSLSLVMSSFTSFVKYAPVGIALIACLSRDQRAIIGSLVSLTIYMLLLHWLTVFEYRLIVIAGIAIILGAGIWFSHAHEWRVQWKTALAIGLLGIIGFSVHLYLPIRSGHNPRIDENNPSRDFRTFVNMLDRRQYGQVSMVERMFNRRGAAEHQFGRHANMGFWSYFEEQYSEGGWVFVPFFVLGLIGMLVAIAKRLELGLPFLTLFLICSIGLVLYMNFADGTRYDPRTTDAYQEVRNRDYFFTPAFIFFGVAMGLGVSGIIQFLRELVAKGRPQAQKALVYVCSVLILLPGISLAKNYYPNDRSENILPLVYARAILDTCDEDAIVFTIGDNDTFPVWCLQEVYDYRKDIRVVNLSLLNTDWYAEQMKNRYGVPMSLETEQILWHPHEYSPGVVGQRPKKPFYDRPRRVWTYLQSHPHEGRMVSVQDMLVDDIVLENRWRNPVYFSGPPYAESPLDLRSRVTEVGALYRLDREVDSTQFDVETTYDFFMNKVTFSGLSDSRMYRDHTATGTFLSLGSRAIVLADQLVAQGDHERALQIVEKLLREYPEYVQAALVRAEWYQKDGDTASARQVLWQAHDTLVAFLERNEKNQYYLQDLGLMKVELGYQLGEQAMIERGAEVCWEGFRCDPNSGYAFRKLIHVLARSNRHGELAEAAEIHARYTRNLDDPYLQYLLGQSHLGDVPGPIGN